MFGFYGKMPAHGDFVRARADVGFVSAWDGWLQASIAASRAALGAAWESLYAAAPLWRFALAEGVCGQRPALGVMMPSQDRVGRLFPLAIFAHPAASPAPAALEREELFGALEEAALSALDGATRGELETRLGAISLPAGLPAGGRGSVWLSTFFGGAPRRDSRSFPELPPPERFVCLLDPVSEGADA